LNKIFLLILLSSCWTETPNQTIFVPYKIIKHVPIKCVLPTFPSLINLHSNDYVDRVDLWIETAAMCLDAKDVYSLRWMLEAAP